MRTHLLSLHLQTTVCPSNTVSLPEKFRRHNRVNKVTLPSKSAGAFQLTWFRRSPTIHAGLRQRAPKTTACPTTTTTTTTTPTTTRPTTVFCSRPPVTLPEKFRRHHYVNKVTPYSRATGIFQLTWFRRSSTVKTDLWANTRATTTTACPTTTTTTTTTTTAQPTTVQPITTSTAPSTITTTSTKTTPCLPDSYYMQRKADDYDSSRYWSMNFGCDNKIDDSVYRCRRSENIHGNQRRQIKYAGLPVDIGATRLSRPVGLYGKRSVS